MSHTTMSNDENQMQRKRRLPELGDPLSLLTLIRSVMLSLLGLGLLLSGLEHAAAEPTPLRVGVTPSFPPMIHKEGGRVVGIEADLARALGVELGRPVQLVEVGWEDQIPALVDGRTDIIMSSMSITRARQLRVAFTKPYLTVGQTVLVRRADVNKYALGFPPRPPGTIGVLKATTGDFLVQQEFPLNKRKVFKTPAQAAKALAKGQIDLFISDFPVVWWLAGMNETEGLVPLRLLLNEEQLAWAVRKSDPELLESVNRALEKLQQDGRAKAVVKRWIPLYQ